MDKFYKRNKLDLLISFKKEINGKLWNSLPDSVRISNLTDFKKALASLNLE